MNHLATLAIANLQALHAQQNPLVRALTGPLVEAMTETVTEMQVVIDEQATALSQLETETQALRTYTLLLQGEHTLALQAAKDLLDQQAAAATKVEAETQALRADTEILKAEHAMALQTTKDRIDQLERHVFGKKSERSTKVSDPRQSARQRHRKELTDKEKEARRQAAAKARQDVLDSLRTKMVEVPLDAEVPAGRPLPALESVIYEWQRGELVRIVVQREQRVLPDKSIVTAPPPPQVVVGGSYGPALHAKVAIDKCLLGIPLRRQERAFLRLGAPLPISVLCALFHRGAEGVRPVYQAMMAQLRSSPHLGADETPQPVLDEDKTRQGWMWVFATDEVVVYVYSPSRGGAVADRVLGNSQGTITVDGFTGYNLVTQSGRRQRGGCWSHARRGLFEARGYAVRLVDDLLEQIGELFYIEHLAIEQRIVGTAAHLELRGERSAPVLARIFETVTQHVGSFDDRSSLAKALRYVLNQREPLSLFLTDARVPIHNNLSERVLRIVAVLRKNVLFVGNDEAGEHLAMLLSVSVTCELHGVDPEVWLADVLIWSSDPRSKLEELLPWNWKVGRGARYAPALDTT